MKNQTSGHIQVDGGKLYYEAAGAGEPIVLLHAGFVDSRMWDDQWDTFAQGHRVIRLDLRGFGRSDPAEALVDRRREVVEALAALGVTKANFVCCSLSGATVLDLALAHPELVTALVLVSAVPSGFELQGEPPAHMMEMIGAMQQGDLALASELQNRIWIDGPFRQPDEVDPQVRKKSAEMNHIALANGTWFKADAAPVRPLNPPAVERLGEVRAPTLIVAGGLDHPEVLRAADVMAAGIPNARKVVMQGCAHLPNMEQPEQFNREVMEFLNNQKG